jgi:hypothetical protein
VQAHDHDIVIEPCDDDLDRAAGDPIPQVAADVTAIPSW